MNGDEVLKNRGGGRTGGRQGAAGTPPAGTPPGGPPPAGAPGGSGRGGIQFGQDEYYIALLGTPSTTTPWMIQFGGHHLAINVTVVGAEQRADAEPAGGAAGDVHAERSDDPPAGQRERQRVRPDQRADAPNSRSRRSSTTRSAISCSARATTAK